jgi:hypothetical protein
VGEKKLPERSTSFTYTVNLDSCISAGWMMHSYLNHTKDRKFKNPTLGIKNIDESKVFIVGHTEIYLHPWVQEVLSKPF